MRDHFEGLGVSLFGAIAVIAVMLAVATVWLFLTNPVTVATRSTRARSRRSSGISRRCCCDALQGLLKYL